MNTATKLRVATVVIIFGLVASGVTAFPLVWELEILASFFAKEGNLDPDAYTGMAHWIMRVREGLVESGKQYPFLAYGTDWLAFGHIIIALFYIPAYFRPAQYRANYLVGIWACILVVPLALICGPIRGIPFAWQLIDCSFGIVCIFPMWLAWKWSGELQATGH